MSKLSQSEIDALFAQYSADPSTTPGAASPAAAVPPGGAAPAPDPSVSGSAADPVNQGIPITFPALDVPPASPVPVGPAGGQTVTQPIGLLANVELDVTVRLGRTRKSIREVLSLGAGTVLELDTVAGEAVDILVNGLLVARGEVVVLGENYGVRIIELVNHPNQGSVQ